ncbi:MAG: ABC transporter substrate-binding protein [Candidatus Riflebacteria bacterium]|nr:ABC transporter substrate-binding protein [Candidatus Riflebacteria bacterium]
MKRLNFYKRVAYFRAIWLLLFSAFLLLNMPCEGRTYKFGMIPWIAYSPLQVAESKGFWRELGVGVEVVSFSTNPELYTAIASSDIDLSMDMIGSMVGMYQDGIPVVVLGESDWSHGGDKVIVKRNLDFSRIKSKPIGVYLDKPSVTFFLNYFLKENNLKFSDTRTFELTMQELADNFISGNYSIILNCDPDALRAEHEGDGRLAATSADYDGCIPEGFVARKDRLKNIPADDLVKIFRGWARAVGWIHDPQNWDEYRKLLNTKTFKDGEPLTDNDLKEMIRSVRIHPLDTQIRRNKQQECLKKYLIDVENFLKENHLLKRDYSLDEILDNKDLLKALELEKMGGRKKK